MATQETYVAQSVKEPPLDNAGEVELVTGERASPQGDPFDFSAPLTVSTRPPVGSSPPAGQNAQKSEMNGWRWFLVGFFVFGNLFFGSMLLWVSRRITIADLDFQGSPLGEYPVALAAVPALSGLFLILKTVFGLFSGCHYGKFGFRTTGLDGKINNWGELGLGTIFGLWGLSEVIKCLY